MRSKHEADVRGRDSWLSIAAFLGVVCLGGVYLAACSADEPRQIEATPPQQPSILFITLDTTRADRLGFESDTFETPHLDALAASGVHFSQAYSTVPMTLPAHASMFTGLYPADHGIHENGRYVSEDHGLLAERLRESGYRTAAFVSGYPLSRQFGLARGFDHFDDDFAGEAERRASATTDVALAHLERSSNEPLFLWVHYFDPHEPYDPPEPFASRYPTDPYQGEIAFMDEELGRLLAGFEEAAASGESRIIVVGDHGEGLGDHGEALHGRLLYQGVMRVPLVVAGTGIEAGRIDEPVSTRQAFETVLGWADGDESPGWLTGGGKPVLGEALKPFLQYGWQPQIMGVSGTTKIIRSGETEAYDIASDPQENRNLAGEIELDRELLRAMSEYAVSPVSDNGEGETLSEEAVRKLASLGYFDSGPGRGERENAPNPKDMTHIFRDLDVGSALFIRQEYENAVPVFSRVLAEDPENLVVSLRLAVAHSVLGHEKEAQGFFERSRDISPESIDLRHYHAMHYFRFGQWEQAKPLFESVLAEMPKRLPALECMAQIEEKDGRLEESRRYFELVVELKDEPVAELLRLGELSMAVQDTGGAIDAFAHALRLQGDEFAHFLEIGVCYLAVSRYAEAGDALDRVSPSHPGYPMALFKRAQAAVLMKDPDWRKRVRRAAENSDEVTQQLIEQEQLFNGFTGR